MQPSRMSQSKYNFFFSVSFLKRCLQVENVTVTLRYECFAAVITEPQIT